MSKHMTSAAIDALDDDDGLTGVNGDRLTVAERKAVDALHRLVRRWPQSLGLMAMDGRLCVIHADDDRAHGVAWSERRESVLAFIDINSRSGD